MPPSFIEVDAWVSSRRGRRRDRAIASAKAKRASRHHPAAAASFLELRQPADTKQGLRVKGGSDKLTVTDGDCALCQYFVQMTDLYFRQQSDRYRTSDSSRDQPFAMPYPSRGLSRSSIRPVFLEEERLRRIAATRPSTQQQRLHRAKSSNARQASVMPASRRVGWEPAKTLADIQGRDMVEPAYTRQDLSSFRGGRQQPAAADSSFVELGASLRQAPGAAAAGAAADDGPKAGPELKAEKVAAMRPDWLKQQEGADNPSWLQASGTFSDALPKVYDKLESLCARRAPNELLESCTKVLQKFKAVATAVRFGSRPDEICASVTAQCGAASYVKKGPHKEPPMSSK